MGLPWEQTQVFLLFLEPQWRTESKLVVFWSSIKSTKVNMIALNTKNSVNLYIQRYYQFESHACSKIFHSHRIVTWFLCLGRLYKISIKNSNLTDQSAPVFGGSCPACIYIMWVLGVMHMNWVWITFKWALVYAAVTIHEVALRATPGNEVALFKCFYNSQQCRWLTEVMILWHKILVKFRFLWKAFEL